MKSRMVARVALCGLALMVVVGASAASKQTKKESPKQVQSSPEQDFKLGKNSEILLNLFREINMFYVDSVDADRLTVDAARGLTSRLDPYTVYLPEQDMEQFAMMTTGKYGGIGSLIRLHGDYVIIAKPYKDSPADRAGLKVGDKILNIGGQDMTGATTEKVSSLLKGDPGTTVKLKIKRWLTDQEVDLAIKRERIAISGVPFHGWVSDSVGFIQLSEFTEDSANDLRKAFVELKNTGRLKSLVIDLRGNGGGILQEAVKIISLFVPKGTEVVATRGKNSSSDASFKTESDPLDLHTPIAVLTNSGSASASEIVAGALQDLDRAVIIGQRTFGKGLVQGTRHMGYNTYLKVTTAKYYIPSGRCIQAIDYTHRNEDGSVGIVPDSLIKAFTTSNGRTVYDGGGIAPDVKLEADYMSRFAMITYGKSYIDDFADLYYKKNILKEFNPLTFTLTDGDYAEFVAFMADKDVAYESESKALVEQLRIKAERERYLDKIKEQLDAIELQLTDDKNTNLQLHKAEIVEILEDEIILRHSYAQGVAQRRMPADPEVKRAVEVLSNRAEYDKILANVEQKSDF